MRIISLYGRIPKLVLTERDEKFLKSIRSVLDKDLTEEQRVQLDRIQLKLYLEFRAQGLAVTRPKMLSYASDRLNRPT